MSCSELLAFFDMFSQPLHSKEISDVIWRNVVSVKPPFVNLVLSWTMLHRSSPEVCLPALLHDQMYAQLCGQSMSMCVCICVSLHVSSLHSTMYLYQLYL